MFKKLIKDALLTNKDKLVEGKDLLWHSIDEYSDLELSDHCWLDHIFETDDVYNPDISAGQYETAEGTVKQYVWCDFEITVKPDGTMMISRVHEE